MFIFDSEEKTPPKWLMEIIPELKEKESRWNPGNFHNQAPAFAYAIDDKSAHIFVVTNARFPNTIEYKNAKLELSDIFGKEEPIIKLQNNIFETLSDVKQQITTNNNKRQSKKRESYYSWDKR
jgi:hypothetical protein